MNKPFDFDDVMNYVHVMYRIYKREINDMQNQPVDYIANLMVKFNTLIQMLETLEVDTKKQLDYWDVQDAKSN